MRRLSLSRPARRGCLLLAAVLVGLLSVVGGPRNVPAGTFFSPVPAAAADVTVTQTDLRVPGTPEADGTPVSLDATILETAGTEPRPAIVLNHGFGGTKADTFTIGRTLARKGYVVIAWTQRGFGRSGGKIHLDDPAYEGKDAVAMVDLAASRSEVAKDGTDPVVGFAGASYGGAISLVAAGLDPRIDAIVPGFTWHNLNEAFFPQYAVTSADQRGPADVVPVTDVGVFKQRWASLFFAGGNGTDRGDPGSADATCGRFAADVCAGYRRAATTGTGSADLRRLLDRAGAPSLLSKITAPTLLIQGESDTLFPLDQAEANARGLPASTTTAITWDAGGHDTGIDLDTSQLSEWFGRYLKHDGSPVDTAFRYAVPQTSLVGDVGGNNTPEVRRLPAYPGLHGAPFATRSVALTGDPQPVGSPPGGSPAALTNLPGTGGALRGLSTVGGYALGVLPDQSAVFTSTAVDGPLRLTGSGRVDLRVTSDTTSATLFVSLWDLGPDRTTSTSTATPAGAGAGTGTDGAAGRSAAPSSAVLPQLAVAPVAVRGLTPGTAQTIRVALPPVSHEVPVGHRVQLVVASTDQAYAVPRSAAVYQIGLVGGSVVLPLVDGVSTTSALDVPLALVIVVAALVLASVVALVISILRRRAVHARADLRDVPLVVDGLVKTYRSAGAGGGFKAVDGVSFRAEPGQVVGLLGPNGAGKTTTLRMLVGLIRPDAGEIFVQGEPVHAGADVLGSVGALIEGPGFLPHLTGIQNLRGYWDATGRPAMEAHLEETLAIAGLGSAVHRKVRGYSQGMRQRLGIAQAMLGLPALLLLDEPTNGLDPPQIKAMRRVLADYAAAGRTVVVSSHLLAEVQQTCSHVVVMNQGRVVLVGSTAELTASNDVTLIGLADPAQTERAAAVIARAGGRAELDEDGLRVHGGLPRPELVAALVDAGIRIDAVDGHRQLEEVFMSLVGESTP
ncbi:MAG: alpha/beta fold hydrolase [Propionibacteriaceae bacterium]